MFFAVGGRCRSHNLLPFAVFDVFDMFVCISFMCLRVHVDLIQPLAARNNKRCLLPLGDPGPSHITWILGPTWVHTLNGTSIG